MDESEYLSIPAHYMKEIPKDVWYSWPMEIRKTFFQMISDPNFFFYNNRPFNQEVHGENIELNDFEKKDFWKRVEYFFSKLGITNLRSLDSLWGYFAIPFKYRTGQILKYYFYLPENKRKLLSTLTDYNIGGNSKSLVKINLIEKEAQEYIVAYIHDFINSTTRQPYTVEPPVIDRRYMLPPNQPFIPNYNIANENQIQPKNNINLSDNHSLNPTGSNYTIGNPQQELPIRYIPTIKNDFISLYTIDQGQKQSLENSESQNQSSSANVEQFVPNGEKRGRGRPRKYPVTDPPPVHIPKKRGRKKKSEFEMENFIDMNNKESGNIGQIQGSFNQIGNHEQNKIIVLSDTNNSSTETENQNQKDQSFENTTSEIDKNDESSNAEKYDEETEDSEQMLRKFIVSDSSYSYDSDDKDDDEYRETRSKPKSYYSLKGRKKTQKTQNKLQFSNFGPKILIEHGMNMNENNHNYPNPRGYDYGRYNNGFNNYNSFNNDYNQFYNRGYSNMSIISVQPSKSPTNNTQIFKINQPVQFIHDDVKIGIQNQQPGYQPIYQMQPNRFQSIQPNNEIKIVAITPFSAKSIQMLSNAAQKAIKTQKHPAQPAKSPTKNYVMNIPNNEKLSSLLQSSQPPHHPSNVVIEHAPSLPTKPPPFPPQIKSIVDITPSLPTQPPPPPINPVVDHTTSLPTNPPPPSAAKNTKNVRKYTIKFDRNIPQKENILSPVKEPETLVKKPNNSLITDNKPPITSVNPNPAPYYDILQSQQRKTTESFPKPEPKQIQDIPPIKQHISLPLPFDESNNFQKEIKKNQQENEYDSDSNSYPEENLADDESNQNYSSSNNESGKISFIGQNKQAQYQSEESSDESDNQNEEADTEMNDYYDNDYENSENENEKPNDEELDPTLQMRQRRPFNRAKQSSVDEDEYNDNEPVEITGIISSLTYFYDECSNNNDSTRISKLKPSSLIDLEFKQHSS